MYVFSTGTWFLWRLHRTITIIVLIGSVETLEPLQVWHYWNPKSNTHTCIRSCVGTLCPHYKCGSIGTLCPLHVWQYQVWLSIESNIQLCQSINYHGSPCTICNIVSCCDAAMTKAFQVHLPWSKLHSLSNCYKFQSITKDSWHNYNSNPSSIS